MFEDKLILLRKKAGWTQEELAERMGVTRQSVSKWEGAQSVPDLEKIVRLAELFGVSTDYLLKDEIAGEDTAARTAPGVVGGVRRRVTVEEANAFLTAKASAAKAAATAVFLCCISPVCLLILSAVSELTDTGLTDTAAGGIGMIVMLLFVAAAVAKFVSSAGKTAPFSYLDGEFETEYAVSEMARERMVRYRQKYMRENVTGAMLCVLSLVPMFIGLLFAPENELLVVVLLSLMFVIAGGGAFLFVHAGMVRGSFLKLLRESAR